MLCGKLQASNLEMLMMNGVCAASEPRTDYELAMINGLSEEEVKSLINVHHRMTKVAERDSRGLWQALFF